MFLHQYIARTHFIQAIGSDIGKGCFKQASMQYMIEESAKEQRFAAYVILSTHTGLKGG